MKFYNWIWFFPLWILCFVLVLFAMCIDNIFWISASPEYPEFKKYSFKQKLKYIFNYRIKSVLIDWRDLIPATITSFIMSLILVIIGKGIIKNEKKN